MFRIRKEQMEAFEDAKLPAFEDYMVQHLHSFAERHCKLLGEPGVREVIQLGVQNAAKYDMSLRRSVRLYIELMFILGSGFDSDPQLLWASEILSEQGATDENIRTDKLYDASMNYHEQVIGEDSKHAQNAVRGIHKHAEEVFALSEQDFAEQILRYMKNVYPQKYDHTGKNGLESLIPRAQQLSESISATSQRAVALFVTLMFAFGHGCCNDPLYPWISGTLNNDKSIYDPDDRVDRLFEKTKMYMDHMLNYLDTE